MWVNFKQTARFLSVFFLNGPQFVTCTEIFCKIGWIFIRRPVRTLRRLIAAAFLAFFFFLVFVTPTIILAGEILGVLASRDFAIPETDWFKDSTAFLIFFFFSCTLKRF